MKQLTNSTVPQSDEEKKRRKSERSKKYYVANRERLLTQSKTYQRGNPKRREYQLQKRYGLTTDDWAALFTSQGNCCAICSADDPGSKTGWHTDHCHDTGRVRGILCHPCNVMLGQSRDNISTLSKAIDYLKAHNG